MECYGRRRHSVQVAECSGKKSWLLIEEKSSETSEKKAVEQFVQMQSEEAVQVSVSFEKCISHTS